MPPRPNKDRQLKSARNKLRAGERSAKAPSKNIGDQVGGWLGGAAKGVYNYSESQARTFTNPYINAAGRAIGKNPNLPVSGAKEAITNTAWGVVDVASGPIGRAAGKGVTAVGRAVAKTGVPARVVNKLTKQEVLLHGRKTAGYPEIKPMGGKYEGLPDSQRQYAVAWYDNPQVARDFDLAKSYGFSSPEKLGTVYAVRGKAKTFTQGDYVTPAKFKTDLIVQSSKNQKVVGSVNLTGNTGVDDAAIARMLKKAGGTVPASMRKGRGGGAKKR